MFKDIIKKIKEYNKIIIHVHKNADGDCTGSAIGLREIIKASFNNKEVFIVGEEAGYLSFLGKFDKVEDNAYKGALSIVVDTPIKKRVADERFQLGDFLIKIDHHELVDEFADIEYVDVNSPATAQIIMQMLLENKDKLKITKKGLEALYTGIITDTGGLRYRGVTSKTFNIVGYMFDREIDFSFIHEQLSKTSENLIRFKGNLLLNYKKTENGFAYFIIEYIMLEEFGITKEEAVSLVNELSRFEDSPVWAVISETSNTGKYRVRLRSKGPFINQFANKYDGGGHKLASGATIESKEKINDFLEDIDIFVKEWKEQN